ncbi:MAG: hypothetical protein O7G83_07910 [Proteobacteria bacterium]|nr:hypothetical protein [Pseudomonadota bacterium]
MLNQQHPFSDRNISLLHRSDTDGSSETGGAIAVSIFGGWMTDNRWEEVFTPWKLEFRDSSFAGLAGSRRIWCLDDDLSFEIEGQIVRHFGEQDHWELNLPLIVRWETFPWNDIIETSAAFGLGPSFASDVPKEEIAMDGESQHWLVYWVLELAMGMPETDWKGILRLHHRSGAFGIVADEGGSNVMAVGLRRRF